MFQSFNPPYTLYIQMLTYTRTFIDTDSTVPKGGESENLLINLCFSHQKIFLKDSDFCN
jgi:hypothetical protein